MTKAFTKSQRYLRQKRYLDLKHYLQIGSLMLIFCVLILLLYKFYFQQSLQLLQYYTKSNCTITNIILITVNVNCWIGAYANIVPMPCVQILASSRTLTNVTFYRNLAEKFYAVNNQADVSQALI